MSVRSILKNYFIVGKKPSAGQFADLINSFWHKTDDVIPVTSVDGLQNALAGKASIEQATSEFKGIITPTTVVPDTTGKSVKYTATTAQTLPNLIDQHGDAIVIASDDITNKLCELIVTDGVAVKVVRPITDLSNYPTKPEFNPVKEVTDNFSITSGKKVKIIDGDGNRSFIALPNGLIKLTGFDAPTVERLKQQIVSWSLETNYKSIVFRDGSGNTAVKINESGELAFAKLSRKTLIRLSVDLGFQKKVYGKKVNILGDSISTFNGSNAANIPTETTYGGLLVAEQNCTIFRSTQSGTALAEGGQHQGPPFCDDARLASMSTSTPNVILIFGGVNDFIQQIPLGTLGSTDKGTVYGALGYIYSYLLYNNPTARIFHMRPLHMHYMEGMSPTIPEFNSQYYLTDVYTAIEKVAEKYGVGIIRTDRCGITSYNIASMSNDSIHPLQAGHRLIYNMVVNELEVQL